MKKTKRFVDRVLGGFLVALMGASVVNVLWQVFTRFVMGNPSSFTEELARFLLIWIGVLGAGYAVGQRDHLALELVPETLEGRAYELVQVVIQACVILFAVSMMIVGGVQLAFSQLTMGQVSASLGVPIGYVYIVLPLSGAAMVFYAAVHIAGHVRALRADTAETSTKSAVEAEQHGKDSTIEGGGL